ncbi:hypothetical protein NE865_13855 [Phthorimaea operculella]|nr:hypothetical protein NE865_13855 [Phthorimaea operculella]
MATWNVRSLVKPGKIDNLILEMKRLQLDIIGLSEVRWKDNGRYDTEDAVLYYSGQPSSEEHHHYHGVGVLIKKELTRYVTNFVPVSERCILLQLSGQPFDVNIIQIYAPTTEKAEKDPDLLERFYSEEWEVYYGRFKQFLKLNETVIKEDTSKCALLLSNLADDTYRLARNLLHPKDLEKVTFGELTTALDGHFKPKQCTFADRAKFYDARRSPGESVDDWAARLRGLAIRCEFGTALDQLITDRFVLGMSAGHERERLFEEDAVKLKFSKALEVAQKAAFARLAQEQQHVIVKQEPVYRVQNQYVAPARGRNGGTRGGASNGGRHGGPHGGSGGSELHRRCGVCGLKSHDSESCRFSGYRCRGCGVIGHLVKVCKNKNSVRVNNLSSNGEQEQPTDESQECKECDLFNMSPSTENEVVTNNVQPNSPLHVASPSSSPALSSPAAVVVPSGGSTATFDDEVQMDEDEWGKRKDF